jgi:hypothetical protein
MKIQSTLITEQTADGAVIEMFLAEEPRGDGALPKEFLMLRLSVPSDSVQHVAVLQLIALRNARTLIDARIQGAQDQLRLRDIDIP